MPRTIAVVGGGAAGVILSAHLLRAASASRPVRVLLVDPVETPGRGLPYRTTDPRHTLNAVVARLSAFDEDPEHLLRWCAAAGVPAEAGTFLQRADFGRYLAELIPSVPVPDGSSVRHVRGTVVDADDEPHATQEPNGAHPPAGPGVVLTLADGTTLHADSAVLALGTPPPVRLPEYEPWGDRYVADPWSPDLDTRAAGARRVLVVGTGLTTLDVVAHLHPLLPDAQFTAVSRGGVLPAAHAPTRCRPRSRWSWSRSWTALPRSPARSTSSAAVRTPSARRAATATLPHRARSRSYTAAGSGLVVVSVSGVRPSRSARRSDRVVVVAVIFPVLSAPGAHARRRPERTACPARCNGKSGLSLAGRAGV